MPRGSILFFTPCRRHIAFLKLVVSQYVVIISSCCQPFTCRSDCHLVVIQAVGYQAFIYQVVAYKTVAYQTVTYQAVAYQAIACQIVSYIRLTFIRNQLVRQLPRLIVCCIFYLSHFCRYSFVLGVERLFGLTNLSICLSF